MKYLHAPLLLAGAFIAPATWVVQDSGTKVQFRGISAVSAKVCWAAGAEGTFARTVDGTHWTSQQIPGLDKLTFRSVVAWDANRATLLAIGAGALSRIYHTDDGGKSWRLQFKNPDPKAFYDCIQFWDRRHGIAFSDPVEGKFLVISTSDGGNTWNVLPTAGMPPALPGEGAFAASGSCLVVHGSRDAWFATGGAKASRVFHSSDRGLHWTVAETPIPAGKETAGIFGLAFRDEKEGIAVGGDYKNPEGGNNHVAVTDDGGRTWSIPGATPNALYECAGLVLDAHLVIVGPINTMESGLIGDALVAPVVPWVVTRRLKGLHTCSLAGGVGWAAGDGGQIVKWFFSGDL